MVGDDSVRRFDVADDGNCGQIDADGEGIGGCRDDCGYTYGWNFEICINQGFYWGGINCSWDDHVAEDGVYQFYVICSSIFYSFIHIHLIFACIVIFKWRRMWRTKWRIRRWWS